MNNNPLTQPKVFFNRPYPRTGNQWVILVLLPLFIALFLVVFQPFGLQMFRHEHKQLLLAGYGLVTFFVLLLDMVLLPLILPGLFSESHWTILRELLFLVWIVISISLGNYIYSMIFSIVQRSGLYGLLVFLGFTFAIAIFPIFVIILVKHNVMLRRHLEGAGEVSRLIAHRENKEGDNTDITLYSENRQNRVTIRASQLLCIESEGNYANLYLAAEGKIIRHVLRSTLKNIESQLEGKQDFFRCHRAYILNMSHIEHAEGNSQGYRVSLKYFSREVPVSRKYTRAFNSVLRPS